MLFLVACSVNIYSELVMGSMEPCSFGFLLYGNIQFICFVTKSAVKLCALLLSLYSNFRSRGETLVHVLSLLGFMKCILPLFVHLYPRMNSLCKLTANLLNHVLNALFWESNFLCTHTKIESNLSLSQRLQNSALENIE